MSPLIHTSRHARPRHRRLGITLIELMVALGITTFVILVVNQLFNSVNSTVARGVQASEMLQKSREINGQLAFETELKISDPANPSLWHSRMVGPAGRNSGDPGGFLAIVQRTVRAPLTLEDAIKPETDPTKYKLIRSDQLMFIYDQEPQNLSNPGLKRLPAMAPSSQYSFTGDQRNADQADYVRMWYGHVLQIREGDDPDADYNMMAPASHASLDLGNTNGQGNPNILAQDWVLGRHALLLTDSSSNLPLPRPYGAYVGADALGIRANAGLTDAPGRLANGMCDVSILTLKDLTGNDPAHPPLGIYSNKVNPAGYQSEALFTMFTATPLLTATKPGGTGDVQRMRAWDYAPAHTYFMGGVSDFIVEFAGDLAKGDFTGPIDPTNAGPDGELDRDGRGRIKWYTAPPFANPEGIGGYVYNADYPITTPAPNPGTGTAQYPPHVPPATVDALFNFRQSKNPGSQAAFVWQHEVASIGPPTVVRTPNFTQWPWMLRIRYRLHDRRGEFNGRELLYDPADPRNLLDKPELEPGAWFEVILPVNYQNVK